ncbi:proton-conducting transporter membrane subunit [Methylomicrobium sp. Wu6]|uniref:proton-conducting transporter transmembrane domain-containing protein n=1 Tax=Methylomicrobium sp. Wu6 TaxID=3107928 RepID=UPI002DD68957|nr:proton-conducting transporter membrane subunit [Methylomicrobium sp. Wu6]MEC4750478.1 proton-conducting transporter membrane subunit [Methylomicrobium sp. Wu6]
MDSLVILIPLLPFSAAAILGLGILFDWLTGEEKEGASAGIALWAVTMSGLLSLTLYGADVLGMNRGSFILGTWLQSDTFEISINFLTHGFGLRLSALFGIILAVVLRFSVNYMHREVGFHRFFFVLTLFSGAMQWLVLSGNAVGTFMGWEIAGLCSYLLIAYAYDRPVAAANAARVFVTSRIGDAAFVIGIGLSYAFAESVDWMKLNALSKQLSTGEATGIAFCFALAALVKSAQLPFTPWLLRALEGPTPSSAVFYGSVMVHAGVFLVYLLQPLFEMSPFAMATLAVVGLATAVYSYLLGFTQTDVKTSLIAATSVQLGLMFLECGLGFWQLAGWHLCAHVIVRAYQLLAAPSLMHNILDNPIKPVKPALAKHYWAYTVSLQRFWLDSLIDCVLVRPIGRLSHDLRYFDDYIIDRILGSPAPAIRAISSLAQYEEQKIGARLNDESDQFAQGSGLAGKLAEWTSAVIHGFESRYMLRGYGKNAADFGRRVGQSANRFEAYIIRPRYLVLFVFITLMAAF